MVRRHPGIRRQIAGGDRLHVSSASSQKHRHIQSVSNISRSWPLALIQRVFTVPSAVAALSPALVLHAVQVSAPRSAAGSSPQPAIAFEAIAAARGPPELRSGATRIASPACAHRRNAQWRASAPAPQAHRSRRCVDQVERRLHRGSTEARGGCAGKHVLRQVLPRAIDPATVRASERTRGPCVDRPVWNACSSPERQRLTSSLLVHILHPPP